MMRKFCPREWEKENPNFWQMSLITEIFDKFSNLTSSSKTSLPAEKHR